MIRPAATALVLLLCMALPVVAATPAPDPEAKEEDGGTIRVTPPPLRNPLPEDILKRMRAALVKLENAADEEQALEAAE
ncbi:hypothetical protein [Tranquillimonas alkanivorans]|uniref:Uncharacterized protein n=1 Tax=Tranquillimonas alkanivorans TaxID=441119 RepID=A0A1I5S797_9RHOB|nr:hypothetical protein [Tranquillimonas alkanivorans]SFP66106.1 hypothetical protein SAMN04488047_11059 [Tranquillimonas alkanivorans]